MSYLVSIIIPAYKTAKYIAECLDSILLQKINGIACSSCIEIIVIDDGSPDNTVEILGKYQAIYNNILVIKQANAGQSVARNNGVDFASGKYIYFLDSDDLLPHNALSPLYNLAEKTGSEVIVSHAKAFNKNRSWFVEDHAEVASSSFRKVKFTHRSILIKTPSPCAKLYRRDMLIKHDIKFPTGIKLGEDWIFVIEAMYKANHISSTPDITYLYRGRDDEDNPSCTQIINEKVFYDLILVYKLTYKYELPARQKSLAKLFVLRGILHRLIKFSTDNDFNIVKPILKELSHFFHDHIGYQSLSVFTPQRRLILTLIFHKFYSEAYRVMNGKMNKSCYNKGIYSSDTNITSDYLFLKKAHKINRLKKIRSFSKKIINNSTWIFKYKISSIIVKLTPPPKDKIVLIGERLGKTANDTGYHLFRQLNKKKIKTKNKYYFTIESESKTKGNLIGLENVIKYGSIKHFVIFHRASTYVFSDSMRDVFKNWSEIAHEHTEKKKVFLQHGIFATSRAKGYYDKISMSKRKEQPDKFIVSSELEKKLVCRQFGFNNSEIEITGLSRFDSLPKTNNKKSKKILLLFTWRDWLSNTTNAEFLKSQYYIKLNEIISSRPLIELLSKHEYKLNICLHHQMHKHIKSIQQANNIEIFSMNDTDIQSLIISSDLMITDYSSASFDMLYQNKPVIYYWFDSAKFFATRGGPLICPLTSMPGPTVTNIESLLTSLDEHLSNKCTIQKKYHKKSKSFFKFKDNSNSKRIIEIIERE